MHGQPFLCFDKFEYTYCRNCSKIDGCWVEDRQKYPMNNPAGGWRFALSSANEEMTPLES